MSTMRGKKSKEGKRSRFVVDMDELRRSDEEKRAAERGGGVRGRLRRRGLSPQGRRRLAIVAGALALVALGLVVIFYSWYSGYRSSPVYSLALLADAAERNDRQTIDALLDTDGVTRGLVPQVKAKVAERAAQVEGGPAPIPASVRRYVGVGSDLGHADGHSDRGIADLRASVIPAGAGRPHPRTDARHRLLQREYRHGGDAGGGAGAPVWRRRTSARTGTGW